MAEIQPELLSYLFNINYGVIKQQTDGLTHADSLLQPPFRGNCLNWVLGHIIVHRDKILEALGETRVWDDTLTERYNRESDPITAANSDSARYLKDLLGDLDTSHERLMAVLGRITPTDLEAQRNERSTVGKWIAFYYFHDTYHVGQTEFLRQLAGKNDKVI